ncbi:MAG: hypothetical protein ACLFR1_04370 [Spirochaetia bacterium]
MVQKINRSSIRIFYILLIPVMLFTGCFLFSPSVENQPPVEQPAQQHQEELPPEDPAEDYRDRISGLPVRVRSFLDLTREIIISSQWDEIDTIIEPGYYAHMTEELGMDPQTVLIDAMGLGRSPLPEEPLIGDPANWIEPSSIEHIVYTDWEEDRFCLNVFGTAVDTQGKSIRFVLHVLAAQEEIYITGM